MRLGPVLLAYAAFIALGMPDGLLGIAWPTMRVDFAVPLDAVGMLLIAALDTGRRCEIAELEKGRPKLSVWAPRLRGHPAVRATA